MTTINPTLRASLAQAKPPISCDADDASTYVNNTAWPSLRGRIRLWSGFTIEALNQQFGDLLDMKLPEGVTCPQAQEELEHVTIHSVSDISKLIAWNVSLLGPALEFGKSQLRHQGVRLAHEHIDPVVPGGKSQIRADHLINLIGTPTRTLVVGLGSTSVKFSGVALLNAISQNLNSKHERLMRQLAQACRFANTRYGYIQTDDELTACRFSRTDTVWEAEFMPIPMELSGHNMTTELAIWYMAMLAMPDREDCIIKLRENMAPPVATVEHEANSHTQASVTPTDVNPGQMPSPSGPNPALDNNTGFPTGRPNPALPDNNTGFDAGVGGFSNSASFNADFPIDTNTGLADNSIGNAYDPSSEFATNVQFSDFINLEEEMDIDALQHQQS